MGYREIDDRSIPARNIDGEISGARSSSSTSTSSLLDGSVTTPKLADGAVTAAKLGPATEGYASPVWNPVTGWYYAVLTAASDFIALLNAFYSHVIVKASAGTLGHIRIGARLSIDGDGIVSADVQTPAAGSIALTKLADGSPTADEYVRWDHTTEAWESFDPLSPLSYGAWRAIEYQSNLTNVAGLPNSAWSLLPLATLVVGDSSGEPGDGVDLSSGHLKYAPTAAGWYDLNLYLRVTRPTAPAWVAANVGVGYRINVGGDAPSTGAWKHLDRGWFSTAQPDVVCSHSAMIHLDGETEYLELGWWQANPGPTIYTFPVLEARLEVKQYGII